MSPDAAPSYVAAVLMLYVDLPDTPLRPGPRDHSLARQLYEQGVPISLVESALLLGSPRRLMRPADLPSLSPIRSLGYFQPVQDRNVGSRFHAERGWQVPAGLKPRRVAYRRLLGRGKNKILPHTQKRVRQSLC
jgi:hypothetical protein